MIRLQNINKTFTSGKQEVQALQDINLTIEKGEVFGLIGYSGAGKSTLLRCINLLEHPSSGSVEVDGTQMLQLSKGQLQKQRRKIGMIFQHFNLLHSVSVAENIAFPLRLARTPSAEVKRRVEELLGLVGLEGHASKYPSQLSGGQKQRVAIARALANEPKILLCDEATSALDPQTTRSILDLLLEINERLNLTLVVVTHEMAVVKRICDRVAVMENGRIVEEGTVADIFLDPKQPVTQGLLEVGSPLQASSVGTTDSKDTTDSRRLHEQDGSVQPVHEASIHEESIQQQSVHQQSIQQQSVHEQSIEQQSVHEQSVHEMRKSALLQVAYSGEMTFAPVLSEVAKETSSTFSILRGTVDAVKGIPYGRLTVEWFADGEVLHDVTDQLRARGCRVIQLNEEGSETFGKSRVV